MRIRYSSGLFVHSFSHWNIGFTRFAGPKKFELFISRPLEMLMSADPPVDSFRGVELF
jgi:hypothetical protein